MAPGGKRPSRVVRRALPSPTPPHLSRPGDPPGPLWPAATRRLWLDGWEQGYLDGYARAQYERAELDAAERAA
jgi:hypothetical protein